MGRKVLGRLFRYIFSFFSLECRLRNFQGRRFCNENIISLFSPAGVSRVFVVTYTRLSYLISNYNQNERSNVKY